MRNTEPRAGLIGRKLHRLHDKIVRAVEQGKGIRFSAEDMDLMNFVGVYDVLSAAAAKQVKEEATRRLQERGVLPIETPEDRD